MVIAEHADGLRLLPDAEAIRNRLDELLEESRLLRKLLRLTIRLEGRRRVVPQPTKATPEIAHASR